MGGTAAPQKKALRPAGAGRAPEGVPLGAFAAPREIFGHPAELKRTLQPGHSRFRWQRPPDGENFVGSSRSRCAARDRRIRAPSFFGDFLCSKKVTRASARKLTRPGRNLHFFGVYTIAKTFICSAIGASPT